ncbi:NfeD family protein [Antrihabitans sp. YC2-6]|uniref:NfeD family protein n=1 Tax=Antrihabitans sp. YC2-6 TaxID=2799498 RepID=UPI0018F2B4E1|nr:DUF6319 family protein [Antrihabitans sp. YC2-6]MBJ8346483.1 translation initiation factor [Antrihabitans sp. YC2-6]
MPPRRRSGTEAALTPDDVATLQAALASGKRATVYLRDPMPSLDLPAGTSARVVRIDGSTVIVSPRGVDDELPFELDEIRLTRLAPAPKQERKPAPQPKAVAKPVTAPKPVPTTTPAPAQKPAPTAERSPSDPTPDPVPPADPKPKRGAARVPKKLQDGVLVTIHGGPEDNWTVSVAYGPRPPGKANPVKPEAVERAVAELDDSTARDAVDAVLSAARTAVTNRISDLNRQLEEARAALAALGSAD